MSREELVENLKPVMHRLQTMDFDSESFVDDIERAFPKDGEQMRAVVGLALSGLMNGEICDRQNGDLRFSRVSKPNEETLQFSIDAVHMGGEGPEHTHPKGEVSFCISTEGKPNFDGFAPGWAICRPGSTHVPTVTGGEMLILYFLPGGEVVWK